MFLHKAIQKSTFKDIGVIIIYNTQTENDNLIDYLIDGCNSSITLTTEPTFDNSIFNFNVEIFFDTSDCDVGYVCVRFKFNLNCISSTPSVPCFSHNTLQKIIKVIDKNKIYAITDGVYNNKKMYSCEILNFGFMEFTFDHPFLFNNKLYTFHELYKIHPHIHNVREINYFGKVYNIIGHTEQLHIHNHFTLLDNLIMIGGML
jgi:hypothetical protein